MRVLSPRPPRYRCLYGIHSGSGYYGSEPYWSQYTTLATSLNAQVVRTVLPWNSIEGTQGTRDWTRWDGLVNDTLNAGMVLVANVLGSPPWANGVASSTSDHEYYVPTDPTAFTTWVNNYVNFVTAAATRYRNRIRHWELWNEQDQHYFWKTAPNITQYITWYKAIQSAIKAVDPTALVAIGGLVGISAGPDGSQYSGLAFLQTMYDNGCTSDAVALHPYVDNNGDPTVDYGPFANSFTDIAKIRTKMVNAGQGNAAIWLTEWGWDSSAITSATMQTYITNALQMVRDQYTYVTICAYFQDQDNTAYPNNGLVDTSGALKPGGTTYRNFINSLP